jgi:hypothetical protein
VIAIALADWSSMGIKALVDRPRPLLGRLDPRGFLLQTFDVSGGVNLRNPCRCSSFLGPGRHRGILRARLAS